MKIIFFIDVWYPVYGGAIRSVEYIAQGLAEQGHEITIVTRKLRTKDGIVTPINPNRGYKVIHLGPISNFENIFFRLWWLLYATWIGWRLGPFDIIHGIANLGGIPAKLLSLLSRRPVVYTVHGSGIRVWEKMNRGVISILMKGMEIFVQCKIYYDVEISVDADFFNIAGNINKHKEVIPNGVDTNYYQPGLPGKISNRLLFVGRLHPQKSLPTLLHALKQLPSQVVLHIVGSGNEELRLRTLINELDLNSRVIFKGALYGQELIREYQKAQLFILPSVYEGQPHTILEAWACGLPIVATKVGANPDMFVDSRLGTLVPIEDPVSLADAIESYLQKDLEDYGGFIRQHVIDNYSWQQIIKRHILIYDKLIYEHGS